MPKPVASCRTAVMDGMVVENTINAGAARRRASGVTEFLLINHPLDCPICDQAGECHLQDLSYENGMATSRYQFERRTFDPIDIGETIKLHMTRCILCYRCVKVAEQITDGRVHGVINRGDVSEISTYIEQAIDNDFSGNMIDVCPVGALTDRTFRFAEPRVVHQARGRAPRLRQVQRQDRAVAEGRGSAARHRSQGPVGRGGGIHLQHLPLREEGAERLDRGRARARSTATA